MGKERIVFFFLAHACHRAVTGTNDRFIRQVQNFLEIVSNRVLVGNGPATHRAGKKRVADDRNRSGETSHNERHSSRRMSPGQPCFDVDLADGKFFPSSIFSAAGTGSRAGAKTSAPVSSRSRGKSAT